MKKAPSDGTWPFDVFIDGEDSVVNDVRVTCFGGTSDPQDNGDTASGISTKDPAVRGVALPRRYTGKSKAQLKALGGSPIPAKLPFRSPVEVTDLATGKTITAPFIDVGPAKSTGNALDLTVACAKEFNPRANATNFSAKVSYRIPGGAKFVDGA
jgi:hypothetical protein